MTDPTPADAIAAVFAEEAAPIIAAYFHPDEYAVERVERVPDGYGGTTETPNVVESGRCRLDVSNRLSGERSSGSVVLAVSQYVAELPRDSIITETDTLRINEREFAVTDVKRAGASGMFTEVTLEERS